MTSSSNSLISEVLQQLQNNGSDFWNQNEDQKNSSLLSPSLSSTQPKRLQVPKACSNCRKMHAGCDTERPCRRCVQNGLESTCQDVPRKKRVSRKRPQEDIAEEEIVPKIEIVPKVEDPARYWEETYNELFGGIVPQIQQVSPPTNYNTAIEPYNPYNYEPDPLILSEMPDALRSYNSPIEVTNMAFDDSSSPQIQPSSSNNDLTFLVEQIKELHESNKNLESKLIGVTSELIDMRRDTVLNNTQQMVNNSLGGWYSFGPQNELAISVWRAVPAPEGTCPKNVLVEANAKFVQMLGYSMEVLKNNFHCNNLVRKQDICPDNRDNKNGREWPKRTQIITAFGMKDVFITITPVQEHKTSAPKFFLVYILEASA